MTLTSIPFSAAAEYLPGLATGKTVRFGSILKSAETGRIVGHLQETGVVQSLLQKTLSFDPSGATGLIGLVQDEIIKRKLNVMQQTLGTVQVLQYANLFSSVVGIGVTAASTAIILKRIKELDSALGKIEEAIQNLPAKWQELSLRSRLVDVYTSIERLQEADVRSDSSKILSQVERDLQKDCNHIHDGLCSIVVEAKVDAGLLRALLAALSLCGASEFKALLWLNEREAAQRRSQIRFDMLQELALLMPRDQLALRLQAGKEIAVDISKECSEIRYRTASLTHIAQHLIHHDIEGRSYIETINQEQDEPLLFFPSEQVPA